MTAPAEPFELVDSGEREIATAGRERADASAREAGAGWPDVITAVRRLERATRRMQRLRPV